MKLTYEDVEKSVADVQYQRLGKKTTLCLITLINGFELVGTSACVDPANFDEVIGRELAYKDGLDKLWGYLGYKLQCDIYEREG